MINFSGDSETLHGPIFLFGSNFLCMWADYPHVVGAGCWVQSFSLILDSSVGSWVGIQFRILPSAKENNLLPFDSKIACLRQSIDINNNKVVYRRSQVRMPTGRGVEWAECSLIIGMGCWVQVFNFILGLSAGIQSAGDSVLETLVRILHSAEDDNLSPFKRKSLTCAGATKLTSTHMYIARAMCESQPEVGSGGLNACWSWRRAIEFKFWHVAWSLIAPSVCQQGIKYPSIHPFIHPYIHPSIHTYIHFYSGICTGTGNIFIGDFRMNMDDGFESQLRNGYRFKCDCRFDCNWHIGTIKWETKIDILGWRDRGSNFRPLASRAGALSNTLHLIQLIRWFHKNSI